MTPLLAIVSLVLVTTVRHEGSHALAAWLSGVEIYEVRLLPGVHPELGFYFGYVSRGDGGGWVIDAAPFGAAMLWFGLGIALMRRLQRTSRWWFPAVAVAVLSPLVDLVYNYQGGLWRGGTDVADLFAALPNSLVHVYFLTSIAACVMGLQWLRNSP